MSTDTKDIQADFLDALIREQKVVWVFLVNGIRLSGQLMSFDKYILALQSPTGTQTVFKSAVSTVSESYVMENREREIARCRSMSINLSEDTSVNRGGQSWSRIKCAAPLYSSIPVEEADEISNV